jgi:hypothetical protein
MLYRNYSFTVSSVKNKVFNPIEWTGYIQPHNGNEHNNKSNYTKIKIRVSTFCSCEVPLIYLQHDPMNRRHLGPVWFAK